MDLTISEVTRRNNVLFTNLKGFERSRFLLRVELKFLTEPLRGKLYLANNGQPGERATICRKIYHIAENDELVNRAFQEAMQHPFREFNLNIRRLKSTDRVDDSLLIENCSMRSATDTHLVICHVNHILNNSTTNCSDLARSLLVFDGIALETIENLCLSRRKEERQQSTNGADLNPTTPLSSLKRLLTETERITTNGTSLKCEQKESAAEKEEWALDADYFTPREGFRRATFGCSSIVMACNPPVDGLADELGINFVHGPRSSQTKAAEFRVFASVLENGSNNEDLCGKTKDVICRTVLDCMDQAQPGRMIVFLRNSLQVQEFYEDWHEADVFLRRSMPIFHLTSLDDFPSGNLISVKRPSPHPTNELIKFFKEDKAVLLTSHRMHETNALVEYVYSSAKLILFAGLPQLKQIGSNEFTERVAFNNKRFFGRYPTTALNGFDLNYYRGLEILNGSIRRCLSEYRHTDCGVFILCPWLGATGISNKLTDELTDVRVEKFTECMERFNKFCKL